MAHPAWTLPLTLVVALGLALTAGCGDKDDGDTASDGADGTSAGDGADGSDGADGTVETTYPTGRRMLLYYGHEGYAPESAGKAAFDGVDELWKEAYGWNTDHRETWTEDLSDYRFVGLLAPGARGTASWSDDEVAVFAAALESGTRIAILGDRSACASPVATDLLQALGSGMTFTGDAASANSVVQTDDINGNHQIGEGVSDVVRMKEPCYIDPTGGSAVLRDSQNNVLVAAEQIGSGGEIVLIGDFQFMDDASGYLDQGDTRIFADNLVVVVPDYEPGGGDSGAAGRR